jgi:uncharacterized membrane protein (Fun14 family)
MPGPRPKPKTQRPTSDEQGLGMLIFESLSAGGFAVFITLSAVLILVGIYVYLVWPLTRWDLADVNVEKFTSWSEIALIVIFAAGSALGCWCFSGAAFREKIGRRRNPTVSRSKQF